jgi:hypothetical protein
MKKLKLQTLGLSVNDLLSREQLKKVIGGSGSGGSGGDGCCAHNADWSWQYCDQNMTLSEAKQWATERAVATGQRHYYCCASC